MKEPKVLGDILSVKQIREYSWHMFGYSDVFKEDTLIEDALKEVKKHSLQWKKGINDILKKTSERHFKEFKTCEDVKSDFISKIKDKKDDYDGYLPTGVSQRGGLG